MDLVDEEDVKPAEFGEDAGEVGGFFEDGTAGAQELGADLAGDNVSEGGLAEPRGAGEEDVVQGLVPAAGGLDVDAEVVDDLFLTDELVEAAGTKRELVFGERRVAEHAGGLDGGRDF